MDSGINEGFLNLISVQAESTFGGTVTGSARYIPSKLSFSHRPVLVGNLSKINVWRAMDGDSFSSRFFEGTIEMMYAHGETLALLLSSLLRRSGTSPNYVFDASHLSNRQSLAIGLSYLPNGKHFVFRGAIIESALFTVRAKEQVKVSLAFKAAQMTADGPLTSPVEEEALTATGLQAAVDYDGGSNPRVYDGSFQIINRVDLAQFDEAGVPQAYQPSGILTFSGDLAEWMSNDLTEGDLIAGHVRNLAETSTTLSIVPGAGKLLEIALSRVLARSGTPPGIQYGGIGYRAGVEAQTAETRADRPILTMTL